MPYATNQTAEEIAEQENRVMNALDLLSREPTVSIRRAADVNKVPRSTLMRRLRGFPARAQPLRGPGSLARARAGARLLTDDEEQLVLRYVALLEQMGLDLRIRMLHRIANTIVGRRTDRYESTLPVGDKWVRSFLSRWGLAGKFGRPDDALRDWVDPWFAVSAPFRPPTLWGGGAGAGGSTGGAGTGGAGGSTGGAGTGGAGTGGTGSGGGGGEGEGPAGGAESAEEIDVDEYEGVDVDDEDGTEDADGYGGGHDDGDADADGSADAERGADGDGDRPQQRDRMIRLSQLTAMLYATNDVGELRRLALRIADLAGAAILHVAVVQGMVDRFNATLAHMQAAGSDDGGDGDGGGDGGDGGGDEECGNKRRRVMDSGFGAGIGSGSGSGSESGAGTGAETGTEAGTGTRTGTRTGTGTGIETRTGTTGA